MQDSFANPWHGSSSQVKVKMSYVGSKQGWVLHSQTMRYWHALRTIGVISQVWIDGTNSFVLHDWNGYVVEMF